MYKSILTTVFLALAILATARPLDGNLSLEGMSNKIRSGSIAIANPARPSDSRIQRVVSKDGAILRAEREGATIGPNGEILDQGRPAEVE